MWLIQADTSFHEQGVLHPYRGTQQHVWVADTFFCALVFIYIILTFLIGSCAWFGFEFSVRFIYFLILLPPSFYFNFEFSLFFFFLLYFFLSSYLCFAFLFCFSSFPQLMTTNTQMVSLSLSVCLLFSAFSFLPSRPPPTRPSSHCVTTCHSM